MTEKLMVIDCGYAGTKAITVDGTKMNQVKHFDFKPYSFSEVANRIYKRFKEEKFDKLYIDSNGVGTGLVDQVIAIFEKNDYIFNPKTGEVLPKGVKFSQGGLVVTGNIEWSKISTSSPFEEF